MYVNVAYGIAENPNLEDLSVPLRINNCGHYKIHSTPVETEKPNGRNDYQLIYISEGKGYFFFDASKTPTIVQKGNMVLFKPKEPQIYHYHVEDKTEVYWLHFTGYKIEEYLKRYNIPENDKVFFTGVSPDYQWIFNQIIRELQLQRSDYEEFLKVLFRHLMLTINRYAHEENETKSDMINEIERAAHYFSEHYSEDISVEDYAQEHHISVNWFIHNFKNIMKVTPMQYILSLRISAAKRYLETTNKSIAQIAQAVGYDNPLYFSRIFKKHTGHSPSEYKKKFFHNPKYS